MTSPAIYDPSVERQSATALMVQHLPGAIRLNCTIYDRDRQRYVQLPERVIRIQIDTPIQGERLWRAMVKALREECARWDAGDPPPEIDDAPTP